MLGAAVLFTVAYFAITAFVFDDARGGQAGPVAFDEPFAHSLERLRTPALTGRVIEVSAMGSAPVLLLLALLVYSVILRARDWPGFFHLSVTLLGAGVLSRLLQHLYDRARPDDLVPIIVVTKGSYPSAHLFGAAACYATFAFFYARYARGLATEVACHLAAAAIVILIGVTRVYLGAHHATDVIGGITAGWAWAFFIAALFTALNSRLRGNGGRSGTVLGNHPQER
jgi:undecaprenyl-diphosphatase